MSLPENVIALLTNLAESSAALAEHNPDYSMQQYNTIRTLWGFGTYTEEDCQYASDFILSALDYVKEYGNFDRDKPTNTQTQDPPGPQPTSDSTGESGVYRGGFLADDPIDYRFP